MVLLLSGVFVLDKCLYLLKGDVRGQKKPFKSGFKKIAWSVLKGEKKRKLKVLDYI